MTAPVMHDEVVGDLVYEDNWERRDALQLFDGSYEVALTFEGEADEPLDSSQRDAFARFQQERGPCLKRVEAALLEHYASILPDVRRRLGEGCDASAPSVAEMRELARVLTPTHVIFPIVQQCGRTVGLLFDCTWDPELGVGVRLVDEAVQDVGTQDIVL